MTDLWRTGSGRIMRGIGTPVIGVAPGGTDSNVGAGLPAKAAYQTTTT